MNKKPNSGSFQKGNTLAKGKGRPLGIRDKINRRFLEDLEDDWVDNGPEAIKQAREANPMQYVAMVASLLPREAKISAEHVDFGTVTVQQINIWLENALGTAAKTLDQTPCENRPLLPAPVHIEPQGHGEDVGVSEVSGGPVKPEWLS